MFCPPSDEAAWLLARFPRLLAPSEGFGSTWSRWVRSFVVAPFTQFTIRSFDLQMFLFDVLHMSFIARAGHLVGMTAVNLFVMGALTQLGGPWLAAVYATFLLAWYRAVAREADLWGWWWVMLGIVGALWLAGLGLGSLDWPTWRYGLGVFISGCAITFPHAAEAKLPPRAGDPHRWLSAYEYVFGTEASPTGWRERLRNGARIAAYPWIGLVNEVWASPRLMPYCYLRVMLAFGYAPQLKRKLDGHRDRAWASGNPAIDYVGIGGGTFIRPPAP